MWFIFIFSLLTTTVSVEAKKRSSKILNFSEFAENYSFPTITTNQKVEIYSISMKNSENEKFNELVRTNFA